MLFLLASYLVLACAGEPVKPQPSHITGWATQVAKGNESYKKGCYNLAYEYFMRGYELSSASDQQAGTAVCLNNIGNIYRALGDPESSLDFFDEAQSVYVHLADRAGLRQVLSNKAAALISLNRFEQAEKALADAAFCIYRFRHFRSASR